MKKQYENLLKAYLRAQFLKRRGELGLTQAQIAEIMAVETRTYCNNEKGSSLCNTVSFILFLMYCCPDSQEMLNEIKDMFENASKAPKE